MNKIFKTKYHPATKTCIVCSELARRAGKVASIGIVLTGMIATAQAATETYNSSQTIDVDQTFTNEIDRGVNVVTVTGNGTVVNINKSLTATSKANKSEPVSLLVENGATLNAKTVTLQNILSDTAPTDNIYWLYGKGLLVRGNNTNATIENLTTDVVFKNSLTSSNLSPDSFASYGVAVGYGHNGGSSGNTTTLTLNGDSTINVSNTADTVTYTSEFSGATAPFNHQLSGIRIYRNTGATPKFISNGELTINVTDKSVSDYIVGIYLSGDGSSAELNGKTTITLKSVAEGKFSAGIKIGKPFDSITNGISVTANETLIIDTTGAKNTAGVRLFGDKASLTISDKATGQSQIKSSSSAIIYDTQDYETTVTYWSFNSPASRNTSGDGQTVSLYNTQLSTTSDTASLIKVNAQTVNSLAVAFAGNRVNGWFNNGTFNITDAKFTLSGEKSSAEAANQGWLIEVKAVNNGASSLDVTIDDNATITGLVTKETSSNGTSATLNMALNNGAV